MRRLRNMIVSDDGFSVAELIVAATIGVMVLVAAYTLFTAAMTSFRGIENNTIAARTAAQVLQRMGRPLREAEQVTVARDYEVEVLADPNDDGTNQFVRFYIPTGTHVLKMDMTTQPSHSGTLPPVTVADDV